MAGNQMSEAMANEIFDLLIADVGAAQTDRAGFLFSQCRDEWGCKEFRFCGSLGFGGKLWVNNNRIYVNCYNEDMTKKRENLIANINEKLAEIKSKYKYGENRCF